MKLLKWMKDGGPESRVWGLFLIEWKRFFSVALLLFKDGSREAYHSHAFNALSWVLKGKLIEHPISLLIPGPNYPAHLSDNIYEPSLRPIHTPRTLIHKVESIGNTWVLTFRGPWAKNWTEYLPDEHRFVTLTNGRKEVDIYEEFAREFLGMDEQQ